jgi:hypothetical protein
MKSFRLKAVIGEKYLFPVFFSSKNINKLSYHAAPVPSSPFISCVHMASFIAGRIEANTCRLLHVSN